MAVIEFSSEPVSLSLTLYAPTSEPTHLPRGVKAQVGYYMGRYMYKVYSQKKLGQNIEKWPIGGHLKIFSDFSIRPHLGISKNLGLSHGKIHKTVTYHPNHLVNGSNES